MNPLLILSVFLSFGLRPFFYKPIAKKYPPAVAMLIDGISAVVISIPVLIFSNFEFVWHPILLLTIVSGVCLSYLAKYFQIVLKESTSAQQYILIIALGFGIIANKIFGEPITKGQLFVVISIAIIAFLFFIRIVKNISKSGRIAWFIALTLTSIVITLPTIMLNYTNWISIFLAIGVVNLLTDIYEFSKCRKELKEKNLKITPSIIMVGLFHALGELIFMYANPILGVTSVLIIKRASIPFVMLVSNFVLHKKEDKSLDSIVFATLAGLVAVLYFFYA